MGAALVKVACKRLCYKVLGWQSAASRQAYYTVSGLGRRGCWTGPVLG